MKSLIRFMLVLFSVVTTYSCIENDLSYPDITIGFTSFEVEGQKSVTIDEATRTIDILMGESADISNVKILEWSVTQNAEIVGGMPEYLDLRDTVKFTLRLYDDFVWTIRAEQPIERYIRCDNQVGEAELDIEAKTAYVYVNDSQSLMNVRFNAVKLEPEGSVVRSTMGLVYQDGQSVTVTEDCDFPMVLDCVVMRYFFVDYMGEEICWSVKVLQKAVEVGMESVNPWTFSAGVKGVTDGKGTPLFEYRKAADEEWTAYTDVTVSGTEVTAHITGLQENTDYLVRISNGIIFSAGKAFRTGSAVQLPNMNFDEWSKNDKYPNAPGSDVWDSANSSGAAVTTSPSPDAVEGYAARLESVSAFGMMAAGNIFTGSFVKLAGLGAELDWGTPFSSRPLAMKGYFKYSPEKIGKAKDPYKDKLGQMDECQILVFLTDWTGPFRVNTNEKKFVDLDNDPGIIALGQINTSEKISDYVSFTMPLVYRDTHREPTYVVIAGASSRYGDYFTGGIGSVLHLDEFEFVYDPAELTDEEYAEVFGKADPV